jgi:methylaspartate ammonia-lyase
MNTEVTHSITNFGSSEDELASYLDKVIFLNVDFLPRAIVGKVVGLSESYVSIEKKDGRIIKIRRKAIQAIEPMKVVVD